MEIITLNGIGYTAYMAGEPVYAHNNDYRGIFYSGDNTYGIAGRETGLKASEILRDVGLSPVEVEWRAYCEWRAYGIVFRALPYLAAYNFRLEAGAVVVWEREEK